MCGSFHGIYLFGFPFYTGLCTKVFNLLHLTNFLLALYNFLDVFWYLVRVVRWVSAVRFNSVYLLGVPLLFFLLTCLNCCSNFCFNSMNTFRIPNPSIRISLPVVFLLVFPAALVKYFVSVAWMLLSSHCKGLCFGLKC